MPITQLILLTVINLFNYLDRYLVPAILPRIMTEFSLTQEQGGRLVSAFVFGYFLCAPLFGILGDRWSRPQLMCIGVSLWSVATMSTGFTTGFGMFLLARILVGVGEASFGTIAPGFIKDSIADPVKVNRAFSIFFAAIPVGSALGYVVAGVVVKFLDWNMAFVLAGLPTILLSLLLLSLKDRRVPPAKSTGAGLERVYEIARERLLWFAIGGYVLNTFALTGIAAFVTKYGVGIGFSLDRISTYFGVILVITGFVGTLGGGWLSAWLSKQSPNRTRALLLFTAISAFLGFPFALGAFYTQDQVLFLGLCSMAELFIFAGVAPINSIIVLVCPPHLVTLTQGITIFAINLFGSLLSPIVVGTLADRFDLSLGMCMASMALLLSGFVWLAGCFHRKGYPSHDYD